MAYSARIIEVVIASPSDVAEEREIVRQVIARWNAIYARERSVALMPLGWETHSSPELGDRPQQFINDRILVHADILVGIFWTRVGTSTGKAISGSIEEIEEHLARNKPVMLYFSDAPVPPSKVDQKQYSELLTFKEWARERGLVEGFGSRDEFREKFERQLPLELRDNLYIRQVLTEGAEIKTNGLQDGLTEVKTEAPLGTEALELLRAAAADRHGLIVVEVDLTETNISSNGKSFCSPSDRRSIARYEAALKELERRSFILDSSGRGTLFKITDAGYRFVEADT